MTTDDLTDAERDELELYRAAFGMTPHDRIVWQDSIAKRALAYPNDRRKPRRWEAKPAQWPRRGRPWGEQSERPLAERLAQQARHGPVWGSRRHDQALPVIERYPDPPRQKR